MATAESQLGLIVFPMLTSPNVSPNIILGICKTLEKYLLVYKTDQILKKFNEEAYWGMVWDRRGFRIKESEIIEKAGGRPQPGGPKPAKPPDISDQVKNTKIEIPWKNAMSLEPTWVTVEYPEGKRLLGVKVAPYPVNSEAEMIELLLSDRFRKWSEYAVTRVSRSVIRTLWRIVRGVQFPFLRKRSLTGKIKKDILYGVTRYSDDIFVCLSATEIPEEVFGEPLKIERLFKMGWHSFAVADDAAKRAYFCMREFKGLCSAVSYGHLVASLGKEHLGVYQDVEEVKRSGGGFFSMKTNVKKVFECFKPRKELQKMQYLSEDVVSYFRTLNKQKMDRSIDALKVGNIDKALSAVPYTPFDKIFIFTRKTSPEFVKSYKFAEQVIQNSIELPDNIYQPLATIVALASINRGEEIRRTTKSNLLKTVKAIRRMGYQADEDPTRLFLGTILTLLQSDIPLAAAFKNVKTIALRLETLMGPEPQMSDTMLFATTLLLLKNIKG